MRTTVLINGKKPNLFRQLLSYRPRATNESRENFLTESFAYVLAMDPNVALNIMHAFAGERFAIRKILALTTQVSLTPHGDGRGFPDLRAEIELHSGERAQVWVENKWDSPADTEQLRRYLKKIDTDFSRVANHLVLLTPRHTDASCCPQDGFSTTVSHSTWSRIHEVVKAYRAHATTEEFESFLNEAQQLIVRPITLESARTYRSLGDNDPNGRAFHQNLTAIIERVRDALPVPAGKRIISNYGRIGISFDDARLTFAALYLPNDHETAFVDPEKPLDLILRIEGPYKGKRAEREKLLQRFSTLTAEFEHAGFACNQGKWKSNGNTILLAHDRTGFPFDVGPDDQVQRVLDSFNRMLDILNRPHNSAIVSEVARWA